MPSFAIVNWAPYSGSIAGVTEKTRFGIRKDDAEVKRESINFHWGAGPAFWRGGVLPEDHPSVKFTLRGVSANPVEEVSRSIVDPTGELRIEKSGLTSQRGVYEFGGLQAPAALDSPLMAEFRLALASGDVNTDVDDFTGVVFGLKANDTGIHIKFYYDGVDRWIEIHHATFSVNTVPAGTLTTYIASFDWDQGVPWTYKLLWHPAADWLRLYVSTGDDELIEDILLVDGKVSDFPPPLPSNEQPQIQPLAYFGHGYPDSESISYWHAAYLMNLVSSPVLFGLFQGEHIGFIKTDEVVNYWADVLPKDADRAWKLLPDSFGTIDGQQVITSEPKLRMTRGAHPASYGIYRTEIRVPTTVTMFDFKISARMIDKDLESVSTTVEAFVTDGIKEARFALLEVGGEQAVGLLVGSDPKWIGSYVASPANWLSEFTYRIMFDSSGDVSVKRLVGFENVYQETVFTRGTSSLPNATLPGPGLGFLLNSQAGIAKSELRLGRVRYSTSVRSWESDDLPQPPWVRVPTLPVGGTAVLESGSMVLTNDVENSVMYFKYPEPVLDSSNGTFVEFQAAVSSFEVGGLENPIREVTGVGVSIDDGAFQVTLMFAYAGDSLQRIVFLATNEDYVQNLVDIKAGREEVSGTYAVVDWSAAKLYRVEKSVGGTLRVYIDDAEEPSIELDVHTLSLPPTVSSSAEIRFGSLMNDRTNVSEWQHIHYGVSSGYDIGGYPNIEQEEALELFEHAVNAIVEAEDVGKSDFEGSAARFDSALDYYEDFEEEWPDVGPLSTVFSGTAGEFNSP